MSTEPETAGWWRTLPGALTATAGVVTALTGLIVALHQTGIIGSDASATHGVEHPAPQASVTQSSAVSSAVESPRAPAIESPQAPAIELAQMPASPSVVPFAGKWKGSATDDQGHTFSISIDVAAACTPNHGCGTIDVPSVPCHGVLALAGKVQDTFEFRVDHFTKGSSSACTPGAGEHFALLADGTVLYTTTYEPRRAACSGEWPTSDRQGRNPRHITISSLPAPNNAPPTKRASESVPRYAWPSAPCRS